MVGRAEVVGMMMPRKGGTTRTAGVAAAVAPVCHPLTHGVTTAVIADDTIGRKNGAPAGGVADDTTSSVIAAPVRLRFRRQRETDGGESGKDGECSFHDGV